MQLAGIRTPSFSIDSEELKNNFKERQFLLNHYGNTLRLEWMSMILFLLDNAELNCRTAD
jgi:hypothetical protein